MPSNSEMGGGDSSASAMINPHNPEFLTKKPWYLAGEDGHDGGPTLDHQKAVGGLSHERQPLSLEASDALLEDQRRRQQQQQSQSSFHKGDWVEALQRNKLPYRMCRVVAVYKSTHQVDLQYEDGTVERRVSWQKRHKSGRPRIRRTQSGARSQGHQFYKETYDSKRDAYHGYDRESHNARLTARFEQREAIRQQFRAQLQNGSEDGPNDDKNNSSKDTTTSTTTGGGDASGPTSAAAGDATDEFVQRDEDDRVITTRLARQGGVGGAQMKVTARNLRIREDTAKYLRNLDPNSAYYDPKSRAMRDNPHPQLPASQTDYAGDNFSRSSGDALALAETQLFAWEAAEKSGEALHPQANPSQVELLKKEYQNKSMTLKQEQKKAVLAKYGGGEYLDGSGGLAEAVTNTGGPSNAEAVADARKIRFGVSTQVKQYTADGKPVSSSSSMVPTYKAIPCKYEEDVFINGHTTVWGSYFHKGAFQWGYADDHSLLKMSYCTGEAGRIANDESNELRYGTGEAGSAALAQARAMLAKPRTTTNSSASDAGDQKKNNPLDRSRLYGEADIHAVLDEDKVKEAERRAAEREKQQQDGERKRKFNSLDAEADLTEEDMEAYRRGKARSSDPMNNLGGDQLLEYK